MKNVKKIIPKTIFVMLIVTLFSVTAVATTYYSSISISYRSTMTGTGRSYTGSTHKIVNHLTSRFYNIGDNYCDYYLQRRSGFSYTTTGIKTLNLKNIGSNYTATYVNQVESGTFRYYLTNRYLASDFRYTRVDMIDLMVKRKDTSWKILLEAII